MARTANAAIKAIKSHDSSPSQRRRFNIQEPAVPPAPGTGNNPGTGTGTEKEGDHFPSLITLHSEWTLESEEPSPRSAVVRRIRSRRSSWHVLLSFFYRAILPCFGSVGTGRKEGSTWACPSAADNDKEADPMESPLQEVRPSEGYSEHRRRMMTTKGGHDSTLCCYCVESAEG